MVSCTEHTIEESLNFCLCNVSHFPLSFTDEAFFLALNSIISSAESQKGINAFQRDSVENQKDAIARLCTAVLNRRSLNTMNSFSTRPPWHQNVWIMYQNKEKKFLQKISPHLSQLIVTMAHRNYFRWNNLWILKMATYAKIEDHYSRFNLATF